MLWWYGWACFILRGTAFLVQYDSLKSISEIRLEKKLRRATLHWESTTPFPKSYKNACYHIVWVLWVCVPDQAFLKIDPTPGSCQSLFNPWSRLALSDQDRGQAITPVRLTSLEYPQGRVNVFADNLSQGWLVTVSLQGVMTLHSLYHSVAKVILTSCVRINLRHPQGVPLVDPSTLGGKILYRLAILV